MTNIRILIVTLFSCSFLSVTFGQSLKVDVYKNGLILPFQDFGDKENSLADVFKGEIETVFNQCSDCHFKTVQATFPSAMTLELSQQLSLMDTLTDKAFAPLKTIAGDKTPEIIVFGAYYDEKVSDNIDVKLSFYVPQTGQRVAYHVLSLNRAIAFQNPNLRRLYIQNFILTKIFGLPMTAFKQSNKQMKTTLLGTGVSLGIAGYGLVSSLNSQKNWNEYLAKNPFDTESLYKQKDKTYVNQQTFFFVGTALTAVSTAFLIKKIKQKKNLSILKELDYAHAIPSVSKPSKSLFQLKIITGIQNGVLIQF